MADLIALSTRFIDSGVLDEPANRITHELSEIGDGIAVVEAFSHSVLFETDEGLLAFDASGGMGGDRVVRAARGWSDARLHTLVYTHGHIDHVGGSGYFEADAKDRGYASARVVAHENVSRRFERYELTNGYNLTIVNGEITFEGQQCTGATPGRLLRHGRAA